MNSYSVVSSRLPKRSGSKSLVPATETLEHGTVAREVYILSFVKLVFQSSKTFSNLFHQKFIFMTFIEWFLSIINGYLRLPHFLKTPNK